MRVGCRYALVHSRSSSSGCSDCAQLGQLQRANHPAPVVGWMRAAAAGSAPRAARSRGGIGVVLAADALAQARRRLRRQLQIGQRRPEVEAGAAGHDRDPPPRQRCRRSPRGGLRVAGHVAVGGQRPDADQVVRDARRGRRRRLVGEHRQARVELHRVGRDDLAIDPLGELAAPRRSSPPRWRRRSATTFTPGRRPARCRAGSARWRVDPHLHEGALRRGRREQHRLVAARAAAAEAVVGAARALDQHLLESADQRLVAAPRVVLHALDQPLDALALDLLRHLLVHRGRLGAGAGRVDERERVVEADRVVDLDRSAKSASVSPGKPTITSVVSAMSGIASRMRSTSARYRSRSYVRRMRFRICDEPDCSGRCMCSHATRHSARAAITSARMSLGCGDV